MGVLRWLLQVLFDARERSGSPTFAGYEAESLSRQDYHHFKNLIIPTARGTTSEIDHLVVSKYGLFVVELKDRSGWIFGEERDKHWTAVHFGKRFRFQNPLRQNFGHVMALQELLGIARDKIHDAVVFRGDFEFKTSIPPGVLCNEYESWIAAKRTAVLADAEVSRILARLAEAGRSGSSAIATHTESIRERLASNTTCPKCGRPLRMKVASRGARVGSRFLACSGYPRCRFTKNMDTA